jgi:hypothetical protein
LLRYQGKLILLLISLPFDTLFNKNLLALLLRKFYVIFSYERRGGEKERERENIFFFLEINGIIKKLKNIPNISW